MLGRARWRISENHLLLLADTHCVFSLPLSPVRVCVCAKTRKPVNSLCVRELMNRYVLRHSFSLLFLFPLFRSLARSLSLLFPSSLLFSPSLAALSFTRQLVLVPGPCSGITRQLTRQIRVFRFIE